jgi:surface antigen
MRLVAAIFAMSLALSWAPTAEAARGDARTETRNPAPTSRPAATRPTNTRPAPARTSSSQRAALSRNPGISCVPYARQVTGMSISGNGREWWHNAAGRYARGQRPERGSILSFPASGNMRHGHVAVVSRVLDARVIEIDHANWGGPGIRRGTVMRGVRVMDVSDANDWTQVRVQVGWSAEAFGRVYPTHGFIHNRPHGTGEMLADRTPAPAAARAGNATRTGPAQRQAARQPAQATARATTPVRVANRPVQQASAAR